MLFLKKHTFSQLFYTLQTSGCIDTNSASPVYLSELDYSVFIMNLWPSNAYPQVVEDPLSREGGLIHPSQISK